MDTETHEAESPVTEDQGDEISDTGVLDWYLGLRNRTLDLVGDYAGNERFLLEGDSLLLHCFSDIRIDVEGEHHSIIHFFASVANQPRHKQTVSNFYTWFLLWRASSSLSYDGYATFTLSSSAVCSQISSVSLSAF